MTSAAPSSYDDHTAHDLVVLLGADARCSDGSCGRVTRLVVDPLARTVTHLVVEPAHRSGMGKLVPLSLLTVTADGVSLHCSRSDFAELVHAEVTRFLPGTTGGHGGFASGQALSWPYYGLGGTNSGSGAGLYMGSITPPTVVYDTLPQGELAIRRGDPVHATDGDIGRVEGLAVDPHDRRVTHVLLQHGHLWGRTRVAIPVAAVERLDDGVRLSLAKDDIDQLPAVDLDDDEWSQAASGSDVG